MLRCWNLLFAVITLAALAGCTQRNRVPVNTPTPEVAVAAPIVRPVTEYFDFTGRCEATETVEIRSRVAGYLNKVNFTDGQEVEKGALLYEIDPRPFQATLDQARSDVARWQATTAKATADLKRQEALRAQNVNSQEEYDAAIASRSTAVASQQAAEAAVRNAELNLEFTRITAPIAGRVSRTRVTPGNLISSVDGLVLTTIVQLEPMFVYFDVDERTMLRYQERTRKAGYEAKMQHVKQLKIPVLIGLPSETGNPHEGLLDFVDNRVDPTTGTIRCRGNFTNVPRFLTPGLFVRVRLPFGDPRSAMLVPERAIGSDQSQKFVLVVNSENVVETRRVTLGPLEDGERVIESGLNAEDRVIVNGLQRARPGSTVKPNDVTPKTPTT